MKDTHFLYAAGIFSIAAIIAIFVGYATDSLPKHTYSPVLDHADTTRSAMNTPTEKQVKKNCRCCADSIGELKAFMDELQAREKAKKQSNQHQNKGERQQ